MVYEIRTGRLWLRGFRQADLPSFERFAMSEDYRRYLGKDHPAPSAFVAHNLPVDWDSEPAWVIEIGGAVAGSVFLGANAESGGELACLLDPTHWRLGIATEATAAAIEYAFDARHLERVWASCDARNIASVRVLERLGLRLIETSPREGRLSGEGIYELRREDFPRPE